MKNPFHILAFCAACGVAGFILREGFGFTTADLALIGLAALYAKHAYDIEELKNEIESLRRRAPDAPYSVGA